MISIEVFIPLSLMKHTHTHTPSTKDHLFDQLFLWSFVGLISIKYRLENLIKPKKSAFIYNMKVEI